MKTRAILALTALAGAASMAVAQPALQFRLNGTNSNTVSVAPGAAVNVAVWAVGMPAVGTSMPWTTPPGTGQAGQYAGFLSALFNVSGDSGSWSNNTIAPPFVGPPFGNPGVIAGSNVNGINTGVGFNPPVTGSEFMLWSGTLTVGSSTVNLAATLQPTSSPPQTGFEVALNNIIPGAPTLIVSHFIQTGNATGTINVPAPASLALLGLGGLVAGRRRRA
jgi:hypothetical protein